jgi:metal-dependent amidase/aminoacylase/carboxypeptidase family protein
MNETLLASLRDLQPGLAAIRQDIHAHPEIGMEEERSAAPVAAPR